MGKVLVVAPHGDDEIGAAGAIQKHKECGDFVAVLILCTDNIAPSLDDDHTTLETSQDVVHGATQTKSILGYDNLHFGTLSDQRLDTCILDVIREIEPIYDAIKPDVVYTTHHGDNNQDHRAVFEAMQVVTRPHGLHTPKMFLTMELMTSTEIAPKLNHTSWCPNYYIELTETHVDKKKLALESYNTEIREFPNPRSVKGIDILSKYRGMEIGVELAEAFTMIRQIV